MNETDKAETDAFADKPISAQRSLDEAWQRAADKRGIEYANDIFPGGKAVTGARTVEREKAKVKQIVGIRPRTTDECVARFMRKLNAEQ